MTYILYKELFKTNAIRRYQVKFISRSKNINYLNLLYVSWKGTNVNHMRSFIFSSILDKPIRFSTNYKYFKSFRNTQKWNHLLSKLPCMNYKNDVNAFKQLRKIKRQ